SFPPLPFSLQKLLLPGPAAATESELISAAPAPPLSKLPCLSLCSLATFLLFSMASGEAEPLQYTTTVLRVSIHCEGCKKKVKKVLHSIEGTNS
uniref:HMA domain-containing protein n=1 Tax=Triticum urartu TaxID=4572 RepID=A0A8R7TDG6_TRIUA